MGSQIKLGDVSILLSQPGRFSLEGAPAAEQDSARKTNRM